MGALTAGLLIFALLAVSGAQAQTPPTQASPAQTARPQAPEAGSGRIEQQGARAQRTMVATANPHASRAALQILREGGSATDAAIAAQMVLTLTEPQSSGIGGGAFLMHYNPSRRTVQAW
ncbi:MAG: gamma-glutamyltransferase, partial [Burkholderiales bacterium]